MPVSVTVEMPFDWVGSIAVPAITILISSALAIWVASFERRRAEKEAVRAQAAELIRALGAVARSFARRDADAMNDANLRLDQEINAFAAHLGKRDVPVAKFVGIATALADKAGIEQVPRTAMWLATAVELWLRGQLKSSDFSANMPKTTTTWAEQIDLGDLDAVLRGQPATGIPDSIKMGTRKVAPNS